MASRTLGRDGQASPAETSLGLEGARQSGCVRGQSSRAKAWRPEPCAEQPAPGQGRHVTASRCSPAPECPSPCGAPGHLWQGKGLSQGWEVGAVRLQPWCGGRIRAHPSHTLTRAQHQQRLFPSPTRMAASVWAGEAALRWGRGGRSEGKGFVLLSEPAPPSCPLPSPSAHIRVWHRLLPLTCQGCHRLPPCRREGGPGKFQTRDFWE